MFGAEGGRAEAVACYRCRPVVGGDPSPRPTSRPCRGLVMAMLLWAGGGPAAAAAGRGTILFPTTTVAHPRYSLGR